MKDNNFTQSAAYGFKQGQAKKKKDIKNIEAGLPEKPTSEKSILEKLKDKLKIKDEVW